jgi:hypothetical protein
MSGVAKQPDLLLEVAVDAFEVSIGVCTQHSMMTNLVSFQFTGKQCSLRRQVGSKVKVQAWPSNTGLLGVTIHMTGQYSTKHDHNSRISHKSMQRSATTVPRFGDLPVENYRAIQMQACACTLMHMQFGWDDR